MKIKLFLDKSIEENAELYFDSAKKQKKKVKGAEDALNESYLKLDRLEKQKKKDTAVEKKVAIKREWYEKFRWFISSEGFLVIGGRDATSNEIVVKKHTDKDDLVFHTDMAGSPFFIIKSEGKKIGKKTIEETGAATASFSRAWKLGLNTIDVFYVKPEQVSKEAQSGEYMPKGAFMVRGKTNYLKPNLEVAVGIKEGKIISGPVSAVKKEAEKYVVLEQGKNKPSDTAKKIKKIIGGDLDEIIRMMPTGGTKIKK